MGEKSLLIAGIDPGTTAGYAVIDLEGNLIELKSSKELDINSLISELIQFGRIVIIGTDKKKNPGFVDRLAVKLGAKIVSPDYDLKVIEKRDAVRAYKTNNQHEIDALASAFFALKKISPLLNKINVFVKHYGKEELRNQLMDFVLSKGLSIRDSLEMVEEPKKPETRIIKKVIEEKVLKEKDFLALYDNLKRAERDRDMLKMQNARLRKELKEVREGYEYMFRQMNRSKVDKKVKELLDFKEKRIKLFDTKLRLKDDDIGSLQDEITTLIYFLSNIGERVLLKKLDNLGYEELKEKGDILNITEEDVLLVEDPDIVSDKAIQLLKNEVKIIVYKKPVSRKISDKLPFIFINGKRLKIEENKYFALVDKKEFEEEKRRLSLLDRVVENYKKERMLA